MASWRSVMKIEGSGSASGSESGSGSISLRHGSADPDPHQNVIDPEFNTAPTEFMCWTSLQDVVEAVRDGGDLAISQEVLVTDQGTGAQDFFSYFSFVFWFCCVTPHWERTIVRYCTLLVTNLPGSEKHTPHPPRFWFDNWTCDIPNKDKITSHWPFLYTGLHPCKFWRFPYPGFSSPMHGWASQRYDTTINSTYQDTDTGASTGTCLNITHQFSPGFVCIKRCFLANVG